MQQKYYMMTVELRFGRLLFLETQKTITEFNVFAHGLDISHDFFVRSKYHKKERLK